MTTVDADARLPELVRDFLERSLPPTAVVPATVRVRQTGEMQRKPGGKPLQFRATEDFAVDRVAFSWRARFPIVGPLAMTVVDEFESGDGQLRVSLLGIPLQTLKGPELSVGEVMRYLAELPWAPQAIAANRQLGWEEVDERTVEVASRLAEERVSVRWHFGDDGDLVRISGVRPYSIGGPYVPRPWGGDFHEYVSFDGTRIPAAAEVWWELPEGRFTYWRGLVVALELCPPRPAVLRA